MNDPQPTLTVGLPVLRMHNIAWLAMESLCRQNIQEPWELIIVAEQQIAPDRKFFEQYKERLRQVNCVRFLVLDPPHRMHLNHKWREIAKQSSPSSELLVLQAGDCYSHPNRLTQHHAYRHKDWHHTESGFFYNIGSKKAALFDAHGTQALTGLDMAMRMVWARKLSKHDELSASVDQYLYKHVQRCKGKPVTRQVWRSRPSGLDTHGHNTISRNRGHNIDEAQGYFKNHQFQLEKVVPPDVAERLAKMN